MNAAPAIDIAALRSALAQAIAGEVRFDRLDRAIYVERGSMPGERIAPLTEVMDDSAPYFSIVSTHPPACHNEPAGTSARRAASGANEDDPCSDEKDDGERDQDRPVDADRAGTGIAV